MKEDYAIISNALDLEKGIPTQIKLLPRGKVFSRHGEFIVDKQSFMAMDAHFKMRGIDIVGDYEHQTLKGIQAPAAAWGKQLILKEDGVYLNVEWTEKAQSYLENKEYRYHSPVVMVRKSDRRAVELHSFALTNTPAIDGLEAIINSLNTNIGGSEMEFLKTLAKSLGLREDATEAQILEAIAALVKNGSIKDEEDANTEVVANSTVLSMLSLKNDATEMDVVEAISALKKVPVSHLTEMVALKAQVEKLSEKLGQQDADSLVELALKSGKITPAMKDWAEEMALKDPTAFKAFVDVAPETVLLNEVVTGGKTLKQTGLEQSVNSMLGVTQEDLEKFGGES